MADSFGGTAGRKLKLFARAAIALLAIIAAILLTVEVRTRSAKRRLNALLSAYQARGEAATVTDLSPAQIPDDGNASADYVAAGKLMSASSAAYMESADIPAYLPWTDDELKKIRALLAETRPAFDRARAARGKRDANWGPATSPMLSMNAPYLTPARELADRLAHAALEAHVRGDDRAALEYVRDILALGDALLKSPRGIVPHLVTAGSRGVATSVLRQVAAELRVGDGPTEATRAQLDTLVSYLLDDKRERAAVRDTLMKERVEIVDAYQAFMAGTFNGPNTGTTNVFKFNLYFMRPQLLHEAALLAEWMTDRMNAAAVADDLLTALAHANRLLQDVEQHNDRYSRLMNVLVPPEKRPMTFLFQMRTSCHATAALLGLRLYALEHNGQFPESLNELVSRRYLPTTPTDAMAKGAPPLRFVPDPRDPKVYSVGADGKDDGGDETEPDVDFNLAEAPYEWNSPDAVFHYLRKPRLKKFNPDNIPGGRGEYQPE